MRLLLASTAKNLKKGVRSLGLERKKSQREIESCIIIDGEEEFKRGTKNYVNLSLTHFQPQ